MTSIYLIGSLRQDRVRGVAKLLRGYGHDVFDDWHAAGPEADDIWQQYEQERGSDFLEALNRYPACHTYDYDLRHITRCEVGVMVLPSGKSGHLELGYMLGKGKPGYIILDGAPDRWDVMYKFATGVFYSAEDLIAEGVL